MNQDVRKLLEHELVRFRIDEQVKTKQRYVNEEEGIAYVEGYVSAVVLNRNGIYYEVTPSNVEDVGYRAQLFDWNVLERR